MAERYQRIGMCQSVDRYLTWDGNNFHAYSCPQSLMYQFEKQDAVPFRISDKCCVMFKQKPLEQWGKEHNRIPIIAIRRAEEGRRSTAQCLSFRNKKLHAFQPLAPVTNDFIEWYIQQRNIPLCELYTKYGFDRTGCKGCPFNVRVQRQLDTLKEKLPDEYRQCEIIWKPVYDEYRRIGYRLRKQQQLTIDDIL